MYASVLSAALDVLDFSLICSRRGGKMLISRASAHRSAATSDRREIPPCGFGDSREDDDETNDTNCCAVDACAALMLSAAATVPRSASSDELRAITLYTDPASGHVFTKRCKH